MSKRVLALLLCLCLVLSGCVYSNASEDSLFAAVYRLDADSEGGGALLVKQPVEYSPGENVLDVLLRELNSQPSNTTLRRVFPEEVKALSCQIEQGVATVTLSKEHMGLGDTEKLLTESALVLTFTALDKVCSLSLKCGGRIVKSELRIEALEQADALFESYERTVKLFLPDESGAYLVPCSRSVTVDGSKSIEELIARAVLAEFPLSAGGTLLISAEAESGVCSVDLSEAFYGNEPADITAGMLYIYAIVNSLCRLEHIESVVIRVEGQTVASYGGFRALWPLEANEELIVY